MSRHKTKFTNKSKPAHCRQIKIIFLLVFLACFFDQLASVLASPSPTWASVMLSKLSPAEAEQVRMVIEHSTLQKSVEQFQFRSQPEVFEFLLDNPDFAATVARELRVARYRITRRPDSSYDATDAQEFAALFVCCIL
jgi:hypothetical protein